MRSMTKILDYKTTKLDDRLKIVEDILKLL